MQHDQKQKPVTPAAADSDRDTNSAAGKGSVQIPQITLPKGGGALKNIDEKFQVNSANGTASFSIPLPVSPGRNNFSPSLGLSYNSGVGNSVAGIGWGIDLPSIQRKTDKQLPTYRDAEDTFMFSGAEDLVPMLDAALTPIKDGIAERFCPRIEGSFSKIEKINSPAGTYWKVVSRENVATIFGRDARCRIAHPKDPSRIFKWLPEFSFDDKGNWIKYEYERDDSSQNTLAPFVPGHLHEKNRKSGVQQFTNTYLKRIKYGNIAPYKLERYETDPLDPDPVDDTEKYAFEIVFDYGEHGTPVKLEDEDPDLLTEITVDHNGVLPWNHREDPFSDHRAGFEIRTYRKCQRVLLFHHFDELGSTPCLVSSLDLEYELSHKNAGQFTEVNYLKKITRSGYVRTSGDNYIRQSLPPMVFEYQKLNWDKTVYEASRENILDAPAGLSSGYQWADLYGEGISGIFTEQESGWFYKSNLGDLVKTAGGEYAHDHRARFSRADQVAPKPSFSGLDDGVLQLQDLEADGSKQIVVQSPALKGYFELNDDNEWEPFRAFEQALNVDFRDPNIKLLDLSGDGQPDVVLSEENVFTWYAANGKRGYKPAQYASKPFAEEYGPALVFADEKQSIFLADMSGDGLTDIVRVRNGEVCYWSNMGFGRFSAKVSMSRAPVFDTPDQFNPSYLHLVDISGTGATDIVYLGKNKFRSWLNLSGNAWSPVEEIEYFFPVEQPNQIAAVDLLGNGTGCIVWSSPLPAYSSSPLRYIDLMGGKKPHILTKYSNNFGKETEIEYQSSTFFFLKDKLEGKKWITKLPFPVQCVHKISHRDAFNESVFTTIYDYHHGYYDHSEREFRGFGMAEQRDSESYQLWQRNSGGGLENPALFQHPVLTRTWYHTVEFLRRDIILRQFEDEYFQNTFFAEYHLPDARIETGGIELSADEIREAHRACKGMVLRQEIYVLDDDVLKRDIPLSAAEHNCHIRLVQPRGKNQYASFIAVESETITYHYERNARDPRIAHNFNTRIDELGNVERSVAVVYGRKNGTSPLPSSLEDLANQQSILDSEQQKAHFILTENRFTGDVSTNIAYRLRQMCEVKAFELTGLAGPGFFGLADVKTAADTAAFLDYEEVPSSGFQKRLMEHTRVLFSDSTDLLKPRPFGVMDRLGLTHEDYKLAFSTGYINSTNILDGRVNDTMLGNKNTGGAYRKSIDLKTQGFPVTDPDDRWWVASGTRQYGASPEDSFYLPQRYIDPFGHKTDISYEPQYQLFIEKVSDALNNETVVTGFNYRTLQPQQLKDINDNLSEARFDALGFVIGAAIKGKENGSADPLENSGDSFNGFKVLLTEREVRDFLDAPLANGRDLLKDATSRFVYDFHQFRKNGTLPNVSALILREEHTIRNTAPNLQYSFEYSDGWGHSVMKKIQAEPGEAFFIDDNGALQTDPAADPRWIGNGRTVLNNKGKPVKQFEPYFSTTHKFENSKLLVEIGFSPLMFYDAAGRLIKTEFPDETFSEVVFDAWQQQTFDLNDNVLASNWYARRIGGALGSAEKQAAQKTAIHDQTPDTVFLDSLGREFYTVSHNRFKDKTAAVVEEFYANRIELDIENNQRKVIDANYNTVMSFEYDMLGSHLKQTSMDAGTRWILNDCAGKALYGWDSKNNIFRTAYDILRRPEEHRVSLSGAAEIVYDKTVYGTDPAKNENGQVIEKYDGAGIVTQSDIDFKGNAGTAARQFTDDHKTTPDWINIAAVALKPESYATTTVFDALNRPVQITSPDGSITRAIFNQANLLDKVKVNIKGAARTTFVDNIDYDAKGQRRRIDYGNGTFTVYEHDPKTYRLKRMITRRPGEILQDLQYTYDPAGNISLVRDDAQQTVYFNNAGVDPHNDFEYDSLYRLIKGAGREHTAGNQPLDESDSFRMQLPLPGDMTAIQAYEQRYEYDAVGNMLKMIHRAGSGPMINHWTREFAYNTGDPVPAQRNNQLKSTTTAGTTLKYTYDAHGNIENLPHLSGMSWDFENQLESIDKGGGGKVYYNYDADGNRVRKVWEKPGGLTEERLYTGAVEIFTKTQGGLLKLRRETLHVMDDVRRIALVDTRTDAPEQLIRYQYGNHLDTAALELDQAAAIISYEEYYPFGSTSYQSGRSAAEVSLKRYRYTAKERDEESGLYYHGARYYAPWLARWTAPDPIGIGDGLNVFTYSANNPVVFQDSTGTQTEDDPPQMPQKSNAKEDPISMYYQIDPIVITAEKPGFFRSSFFKGLVVGVVAVVAVAAVIATGGAALAAIAPGFVATLAASPVVAGVVTGAAVAGTGYLGVSTVQSLRQRDIFNNKISKEEANFNLGMNIGGLLGGPLVKPVSKFANRLFKPPASVSGVASTEAAVVSETEIAAAANAETSAATEAAAATQAAATTEAATGTRSFQDMAKELVTKTAKGTKSHFNVKHLNKDEGYLAQRLINEPNIPHASTFNSAAEVEAALTAALKNDFTRVSTWLGAGSRGPLTIRAPFSGGSVLSRGASGTVRGNSVEFGLRSNKRGWYIYSGAVNP